MTKEVIIVSLHSSMAWIPEVNVGFTNVGLQNVKDGLKYSKSKTKGEGYEKTDAWQRSGGQRCIRSRC